MNLAKIDEVIKASPAIQIQSRITHLQRRAWNVLLANAYNELSNTDIHRVSVAELARKLGYASNDSEHLKETLEALGDCQVKWNLLNKDKKEKWGFANLLASAEIENGICTYAVRPASAPSTPQPSYSIPNSTYACKTGSRAAMPSFYGKSVSTTSIPIATKAKHRSYPLKPIGS